MNQNPYDSPAATDVIATPRYQSRRAYWYASIAVLLFFVVGIAVIFWATEAEIDGGEIWFHVPNETTFSSGADRIATYDRYISTSLGGLVIMVAILAGLALAIANGLVLIWRSVRRR